MENNQINNNNSNNKLETKTPDDDVVHVPVPNNNNDDVIVVEAPSQNDDDQRAELAREPSSPRSNTRTPFSNLSQIDADLALARTLQEQDDHDIEFDPEVYSSDEAYARALQDAEEREMAARLFALAGISDSSPFVAAGHIQEVEAHIGNAHYSANTIKGLYFSIDIVNRRLCFRLSAVQLLFSDAWDEVDPDELSYEELLALGDVVGHESRGLSADKLASLPSINYKEGSSQNGSNDSCVICRLDYEDSETLTLLSCKHSYHPECINNWLKINKVCPVCSTEVSTSGHS
ncbi:hypothetical protein ACFE04_027845 [Oxalis oulophora]